MRQLPLVMQEQRVFLPSKQSQLFRSEPALYEYCKTLFYLCKLIHLPQVAAKGRDYVRLKNTS